MKLFTAACARRWVLVVVATIGIGNGCRDPKQSDNSVNTEGQLAGLHIAIKDFDDTLLPTGQLGFGRLAPDDGIVSWSVAITNEGTSDRLFNLVDLRVIDMDGRSLNYVMEPGVLLVRAGATDNARVYVQAHFGNPPWRFEFYIGPTDQPLSLSPSPGE